LEFVLNVRPNGNQLEEAASKGSERREARRDQETEKLGEYLLYLTREPGVLLYDYMKGENYYIVCTHNL